MKRLRFHMAEAFPPSDPVALWVMNLSIALGDLRIVAIYATRDEQPDAERLYFVRLFASHLREIAKLVAEDHKNEEVRAFVAALPQPGQDARVEVDRMLHTHPYKHRPDVILWRDLKRVRDDTFHYASDDASHERLRTAMNAVTDLESGHLLDDNEELERNTPTSPRATERMRSTRTIRCRSAERCMSRSSR